MHYIGSMRHELIMKISLDRRSTGHLSKAEGSDAVFKCMLGRSELPESWQIGERLKQRNRSPEIPVLWLLWLVYNQELQQTQNLLKT